MMIQQLKFRTEVLDHSLKIYSLNLTIEAHLIEDVKKDRIKISESRKIQIPNETEIQRSERILLFDKHQRLNIALLTMIRKGLKKLEPHIIDYLGKVPGKAITYILERDNHPDRKYVFELLHSGTLKVHEPPL